MDQKQREQFVTDLNNLSGNYWNYEGRDWQHSLLLRKQFEQNLEKKVVEIESIGRQQLVEQIHQLIQTNEHNVRELNAIYDDELCFFYDELIDQIKKVLE